jgi:uncharacterized protein YutE (UPF0331/DUF86 family)
MDKSSVVHGKDVGSKDEAIRKLKKEHLLIKQESEEFARMLGSRIKTEK